MMLTIMNISKKSSVVTNQRRIKKAEPKLHTLDNVKYRLFNTYNNTVNAH